MSREAPSTSQDGSAALPGQTADGGSKEYEQAGPKGVHWVDMHGYELAEVREFEPSSSDEDEAEDYPYEKKGCCIVC